MNSELLIDAIARQTDRGRTIWDAVLELVRSRGVISKAAILSHFRHDDEVVVRSVLADLVESGFVYQSGRGAGAIYRATGDDALAAGAPVPDDEAAAALVWVAVHRFGPVDEAQLTELLGLDRERVARMIAALVQDGRIERAEGDPPAWRSAACVIPVGAEAGWEAAVFDHFQAMVTAIGAKLRDATHRALPDDATGGATFHLDVGPDHPLRAEVLGLLRETRERASALRVRAEQVPQAGPTSRVIFYVGQCVLEDPEEEGAP